MMKIKQDDGFVDYLLDAGDGRWAKSSMPAQTAEEIARREAVVELTGPEGFELRAGDMRFPKELFEFEESDLRPEAKKPARRRRKA